MRGCLLDTEMPIPDEGDDEVIGHRPSGSLVGFRTSLIGCRTPMPAIAGLRCCDFSALAGRSHPEAAGEHKTFYLVREPYFLYDSSVGKNTDGGRFGDVAKNDEVGRGGTDATRQAAREEEQQESTSHGTSLHPAGAERGETKTGEIGNCPVGSDLRDGIVEHVPEQRRFQADALPSSPTRRQVDPTTRTRCARSGSMLATQPTSSTSRSIARCSTTRSPR